MDLLELQSDPAKYRAALLIETDGGPKPLGKCMDVWQKQDFRALDAGWQRAVQGAGRKATYQWAYLERPRGHSKTHDLGVMSSYALFASRRQLFGVAAAGDQDQARLLRDAVRRLVDCNPWLQPILDVQTNRIINRRTGSALQIISSDAPTSYGLTPDFVVVDELTHWRSRDLWDALLSSAAKRSTCMFVVISNAGFLDDWTWQTRELIRTDPAWYFSRLDGPQASWLTPERLAEQRRLLPPTAYARLWLNEWSSDAGDALPAADIEACVTLPGPILDPEAGYCYGAGLDLGIKHDHSALVIVGVQVGTGKVRLANVQSWAPPAGGQVDLAAVREAILTAYRHYKLVQVRFDPFQAALLAQELWRAGVPMVEMPFVGPNLDLMARTLLESFRSHNIELHRDDELLSDLRSLSIVERGFGFRLQAPAGDRGHADRAFALACILPEAVAAANAAPAPDEDYVLVPSVLL